MTEKEFKNSVIDFVVNMKNENCVHEGEYDRISNYLLSHYNQWKKQGTIPLDVFEGCVDLLCAIVGKSPFLSQQDQEKLSYMEEDLYGTLMGFE